MKLAHLQVSNYRGLRDVSIPLSPFVCITGENNGGKEHGLHDRQNENFVYHEKSHFFPL